MAKKKKKDNWVSRLKKKVKGYFAKQKEAQRKMGKGMQKVGGYKKKKAKKKKKALKTARTKTIESRLKKSGLSDKDIAKFKNKRGY